ncbi:UDP-glucose--hexose-1-phosphate uridylyltransferase [Tenacibaculum xiamenense]|uniref:UDP-glucose--hexose-1-phosphate uridylyltransferase n=1 Tax=Tenacibaculum xiamenense TaxID=1261553 RepID=UPI0038941613
MIDLQKDVHTRINILTNEEVLVSPHRTQRPWEGKLEKKEEKKEITFDEDCYLCPTNIRANGKINPNYKDVFVFTNDFSALTLNSYTKTYKKGVLLKAQTETGICKVICYSPNHSLTFSSMTLDNIEQVIKCWIYEFKELSQLPNINNIQIFENKGKMMGCSNPHPHGQIWAQQTIPSIIKKKTKRFKKHAEYNNETLLEAYINQEIELKERIIYENPDFVVLVPFWAVWPFETMLIPKKGSKNITTLNNDQISSFAKAIKTINNIYDKLFNTNFPYSMGIHQAPVNEKNKGWHWHMIFNPPLLRSATIKKFMVGYEMFGMPQRDITPEKAAKMLQKLL